MNIGFFALKFGTGYLIGGFCLIAIETTVICISKAVYEKRKKIEVKKRLIKDHADLLACQSEEELEEKDEGRETIEEFEKQLQEEKK